MLNASRECKHFPDAPLYGSFRVFRRPCQLGFNVLICPSQRPADPKMRRMNDHRELRGA